MSYKITIVKEETVTKVKEGDYGLVDRRPYTDAEVAEANKSWQNDTVNPAKELREVRGYRPSHEVEEVLTVTVLSQVVEDMDIAAVIKAINNL